MNILYIDKIGIIGADYSEHRVRLNTHGEMRAAFDFYFVSFRIKML